jgi:hypothetical protein
MLLLHLPEAELNNSRELSLRLLKAKLCGKNEKNAEGHPSENTGNKTKHPWPHEIPEKRNPGFEPETQPEREPRVTQGRGHG